MEFPASDDTTPDNCIGQEAQIIDFVEKRFVIEDIDKIRFQNETYHIKQFLPITTPIEFAHDVRLWENYGILTGLSNPITPKTPSYVLDYKLFNGILDTREHCVSVGPSCSPRHTPNYHLFELNANVNNLILKYLFESKIDIYVKLSTARQLNNRIRYILPVSARMSTREQLLSNSILSHCEPRPKDLNLIVLIVYPQLRNGQSYGEIIFTTETLIPVCKYLIAINLFHNASKYYSFKHKVETRKILKRQQLQIDDLREKIDLQYYVS